MFLAGAAYVVNGTNCVEATTGPVLMRRRGLVPEALDSFPPSSSVENIFGFGYKGNMKTRRPSQEGDPLGTQSVMGEPGRSALGMISEQEASELAGQSSLSECLLCLSYRANYCERTQRKEKTKTLSS